MPLTYVGTGAWGAGKGSPLTVAEADGNIRNLDVRVADLEANAPEANEIESITQAGSQLTIHMADGSTFGPFTLPRSLSRAAFAFPVSTTTLSPGSDQAGYYFRCSNVSGCTITINDDDTEGWLDDTEMHFRQCASGALTFVEGSGVTINTPADSDPGTDTLGAVVTLKKAGADTWDLFGKLALT